MDEEILKKLREAGAIAAKAKALARKIVKPGAGLLEIAEQVEGLIFKEGGKIAFPLNVSVNEIAAHFTPDMNTTQTFGDHDIIKVDVGVHIDGYIADTAITLSMDESDEHVKLMEAAEAGLEAGINIAKAGVTMGELGTAIDAAIRENGSIPIRNLTGHSIEHYNLHAGFTVPNVKNDGKNKLEEGMHIAIEPFATNGVGMVTDMPDTSIYEFIAQRPVRNRDARRVLSDAEKKFERLPFARRWLEKDIPRMRLDLALRDLVGVKALYHYPPLMEKGNGLIAQVEKNVVVTADGCEITTP